MEHNPMLDFENGLCITYSDLKKTKNGTPFITLYFEKSTKSTKSGFKSAQINFPQGDFEKVVGYKKHGVEKLWKYVAKYGDIAFDMAVEDASNA